jgi:hypothetical protein
VLFSASLLLCSKLLLLSMERAIALSLLLLNRPFDELKNSLLDGRRHFITPSLPISVTHIDPPFIFLRSLTAFALKARQSQPQQQLSRLY